MMTPKNWIFIVGLILFSGYGMTRASSATQPITATEPAAGRQWVVDQANPRADDAGAGTADQPFKTIAPAAAQAQPGDTVLVKAGIYRECVIPARGGEKDRPITYLAEPEHQVIVRGSDVWKTQWRDEGLGIYFATYDSPIFSRGNPFLQKVFKPDLGRSVVLKHAPGDHSLGQLFVNDHELIEVKQRDDLNKTPGAWLVSQKGLFVHFPTGVTPEKAQIEASVRHSIFRPYRRGLSYITIRGFVFERSADAGPYPQTGAVNTRSGKGWVIEDNIVRNAKSVGIACGSETWKPKTLEDTDLADQRLIIGGEHLIRGNTVSDCGVCGITGWSTSGTRIIGNIVERNNILHCDVEEEQAGMKFHGPNVFIEGNLVRNNYAWGIWLDNGWDHSRITRNLVVGNASGGIFLELANGPGMVDHNIVGLSHPSGPSRGGFGIYTHDSSGVTLANNLIWGNTAQGIMMRTVTNRKVKKIDLVTTSHERVFNNIIVGQAAMSLPYPNPRSQDNESNWNLFAAKSPMFTINWNQIPKEFREKAEKKSHVSDGDIDLSEWQKVLAADKNSQIAPGLTVQYDPQTFKVTINVPAAAAAMRCPPVPGLDRDFLGNAYPAGDVAPGPLMNLHAGEQTIQLWPIPE